MGTVSKYIFLAIIALFLSAVLFLTTTTQGLRITLKLLEDIIPGKLTIQLSSGALNRSIKIKSLIYQNEDVSVKATDISLKLLPIALILNDVDVKHLQIDTFNITLLPSKTTKQTTTPYFDLPVKFILDNTSINHLQIHDGKKSLEAQRVQLNAFIKSNHISFTSLTMQYNGSHYWATGAIDLKPILVDIHLSKKENKQDSVELSVKGRGSWKHTVLNVNLIKPIKITSTVTFNNILNKLSWNIEGIAKHLNLSNTNSDSFIGSFKGQGSLNTLQLNAHLSSLSNANSSILLNLSSSNIKQQALLASIQWKDIFWPKFQQSTLVSPQGKIDVKGTLNDFHLSSSMLFSGPNIPSSELQIQGAGDLNKIRFNMIAIKTLGGSINGSGIVSWQPALNYNFELQGKNLHPSSKWSYWPGKVSFLGLAKGENNITQLRINDITGSVRQQALSGNAALSLDHAFITSFNSTLNIGKGHVNISLKRNKYLHAKWNIYIPNISNITPFGNGDITTQGKYTVSNGNPVISGSLSTTDFALFNYQIDKLEANFNVDLNMRRPSILNLNASGININNYSLNELMVSTTGRGARHTINLLAQSQQQTLTSHIIASYLNKTWNLKFRRLTLISPHTHTWNLKRPFTAVYKNKSLSINDFEWHAKKQAISASILIRNRDLRKAKLTVQNFSLKILNMFMPKSLQFGGILNASGNYVRDKNTRSGELKTKLLNASMKYNIEGKPQTIKIKNGIFAAKLNKQGVNGSLNLNFINNDFVNLSLGLFDINFKNILSKNEKTRGSLHSRLSNLSFLKVLSPEINKLTGKLSTNFKWDGTLSQPNFTGTANLSNAEASIPGQGIAIKDLNLSLKAFNKRIHTNLTATSGKGSLRIQGTTTLTDKYETDLDIKGTNFTIDNTPDFHVLISPHLKMRILSHRINLSGSLYLPSALINIDNYANVTTLPYDINVIHTDKAKQSKSIWNSLFANINLTLGNDVHLVNKYISAKLSGKINLIDNPHTQTTANGELTIVKGTFTAFGQQLNIVDGKLLYAGGATTNPGLSIKATKTIKTFVSPTQDSLSQQSLSPTSKSNIIQKANIPMQQKTIVVGVSVTNTLEQPDIALYSDQSNLSQADILSYLILGYPMGQANNQEGEALWQAASALSSGSNEFGGVITKLKQTFDLSQVGFESSNVLDKKTNAVEQNTSLVLGKMLSPKLFVRYSIGLLVPINTLSASYEFTNNWSVQTETSSLGNGVDLLYSWEQN